MSNQEEHRTEPTTPQATALVQQTPFTTTPALKAARTRAWKTLEAYNSAEAEAMFPANAFVRLSISKEKLRQIRVPVTKTKWEDKLSKHEKSPVQQTELDTQDTTRSELDKLFQVQGGPEEREHNATDGKVKGKVSPFDEEKGNVADAAGQLLEIADQDKRQHLVGHISQPSNQVVRSAHGQTLPLHHPVVHQLKSNTSTFNVQPPLDRVPLAETQEDLVLANTSTKTDLSHHQDPLAASRVSDWTTETVRSSHGTVQNQDQNRASLPAPTAARPNNQVASSNNTHSRSPSHTGQTQSASGLYSVFRLDSFLPPLISGTSNTSDSIVGPSAQSRHTNQQRRDPRTRDSPLQGSDHRESADEMAPVRDPDNVHNSLKDAIQKLYNVQSQVHGFVPETQSLLIDEMTDLARSLAHLQTLTSPTLSPNNPIHGNRIAPEVIDYVDDSRNPDIYNREFVELVQRGNAVMNGRQQAFRDFSHVFAKALKEGMPELSDQVDKIMANANMSEGRSNTQQLGEEGGTNGGGKVDKTGETRKEGDGSANGA